MTAKFEFIDLLAERDAIEFIEHRLVKPLDDAIIRYEIRWRRLCVPAAHVREEALR
jgi:hypothetical protein